MSAVLQVLEREQPKRWTDLKQLGKGSFGTVFEAWDEKRRFPVAVKLFRTDFKEFNAKTLDDQKQLFAEQTAWIHREIDVLHCLNVAQAKAKREAIVEMLGHELLCHPLKALPIKTGWQNLVAVFELCDRSLEKEIRVRSLEAQYLSKAEAADWILQLCGGLADMHGAGVIHRDISPRNVLLVLKDKKTLLKYSDFGLAKFIGDKKTSTRHRSMTASVAPELANKDGEYSFETDVFACGMLLKRLLALEFDDRFDVTRADAVIKTRYHGEIARLLQEMTAENPAHRIKALQCYRQASAIAGQPKLLWPRLLVDLDAAANRPACIAAAVLDEVRLQLPTNGEFWSVRATDRLMVCWS